MLATSRSFRKFRSPGHRPGTWRQNRVSISSDENKDPRARQHFGLRRALTVMIVGLGVAQVPALSAQPATAKHDNNGAIPDAEVDRTADADRVPEGLSTSDWSSIRAAYDARRHDAFAVEDGYQTHNPGQRWRTRFDGHGFLTTPDVGGWSWGLKLLRFGREGAEKAVTAPSHVEIDGGRVSYLWDDTLTEWYVNDRRGLEHGYTIWRRPQRTTGETPTLPTGKMPVPHGRFTSKMLVPQLQTTVSPLQLTLAVRGDLLPRIGAGGRVVTFVNDSGAAVVNYHGLSVVDADGAVLPAWFEARGEALMLRVDDRDARYPLTIDPIAQQAYLKASNTDSGDGFGISVAVSGDTVVVGALLEDSNATGVNGNQADNSAVDSGAAYVFVRDAGGTWSQQAYLKASNTGASDQFGVSVAVSGDTVVVGAFGEDSSATGVDGNQDNNSAGTAGAAYVFVRGAAGVWSQQAYLKASNTDAGDNFGFRMAVSGDTVVVGAFRESSIATGIGGNQADNSAIEAGAAYVFVRNAGGTWSQQAYLKASNTDGVIHPSTIGDEFGTSVAVSGDTVVVGAIFERSNATGVNGNQADNSADAAGAAYVFVRDSGGVWSQQAYLKASNTDAFDLFGYSVAVSGDTVVVGAIFERSNATGVNGNQADNSAAFAGVAYVFVRDAVDVWRQQAYLKASNTGAGDQFGRSVGVSGDTVVVGAFSESSIATGIGGNQADNSASDAGAAYVFVRDPGGVWSQQAYLKASNTDSNDFFGNSVAVSGDTVVVGAPGEDSSATGVNGNQANSAGAAGAAYVFVLPPDCNANGIPDECETDGDGDGVIDDCDNCVLPNPAQEDCNNNGIGDACDIADCPGDLPCSDCNANGIPDECETDGDGDGVIDDCDNCVLPNPAQEDCNNNGIGDECELVSSMDFVHQSGQFSPFLSGANATEVIPDPPVATGDVTLTVEVRADLGQVDEFVDAFLNGMSVGRVFESGGAECPTTFDTGSLVIAEATFNALLPGNVTVVLVPSSAVGFCSGVVKLRLSYAIGTGNDCNGNDVPDDCETDTDGDGVIDDCDPCPLDNPDDTDGDGVCDSNDLCSDTPLGLLVDAGGCTLTEGPCCFPGAICIDGTDRQTCEAFPESFFQGEGLTCGDPDGDGIFGCSDGCPLDPDKTHPGVCGCDVADDDGDLDGVADCNDRCLQTPPDVPANVCGCAEVGACCAAEGGCFDDIERTLCAVIAGIYQGDGSTCAQNCALGDLDVDGDVDLSDFAVFARCFTGAGGEGSQACLGADADGCGPIDLGDFSAFRAAFIGP